MQVQHPKSATSQFFTLSRRLMAGAVMANLFVYAIAGLFLYQSRLNLEQRIEITTQNLAQVLEDNISGTIDKINLSLFAVVDQVEQQLVKGSIDRDALNMFIATVHSRVPQLLSIRVADSSGEVLYGIDVVKRVNITDRDYFIQLRDSPTAGMVFGKPVISRMSGKRVLNIARRLNRPDGSFAGVVFAQLTVEYFLQAFSRIDLGRLGTIALRNAELEIIARYPDLDKVLSDSDRKRVSKTYRQLVESGRQDGTFKATYPIDSIERNYTFHKIAEYPLYINVGRATSEYLSVWRKEAVSTVVPLLLFTLGSAVFVNILNVKWKREKQVEVELRRSKDNLEKRTAELERLNRELEGFCYAISHEMRAPIARLQGFSDVVIEEARTCCPENVSRIAERIGVASLRLRTVIDSLLQMSRLSRAEVNKEQVNLSEMAMAITAEFLKDSEERCIKVVVAQDIVVNGDRHMLGICLRNLLGNAFKYTMKKDSAEIEFGCMEIAGEKVYFVRDNGAGFDMAYANKLFEPFCRLHREEEFEGNGIGLPTVQRIIERHDGRIWAEAEENKGAIFYFTLGV